MPFILGEICYYKGFTSLPAISALSQMVLIIFLLMKRFEQRRAGAIWHLFDCVKFVTIALEGRFFWSIEQYVIQQ